MDADRDLIDEQIAYYRARATEYDATSTPAGDPFEADADRIRDRLRALAPMGRVLELAAGTGQWTGILADGADDVLVTDASPEMLELNRARVGDRPNVRFEILDAMALALAGPFDVVFFGFFLSHVPKGRLAPFWAALERLLAPGGRVVFVDEGLHDRWREDWIEPRGGHRAAAAHRWHGASSRQGALAALRARPPAPSARMGRARGDRRAVLLGHRITDAGRTGARQARMTRSTVSAWT
jgi:demethylmenaquinone methyltransferase/2-methoxy-6-polyprenyl-1,4-benzoquinol methylase